MNSLLPAAELWAKSPPAQASANDNGYPLLQHLLDVAAVASILTGEIPCPVAQPMPLEWIWALAGFHDLGKASPGFQTKLGRSHINSYCLEKDQPDRHDISTVGILRDLLRTKELGHRAALALANAVAAHHGSPFTATEIAQGTRWEISPAWAVVHRELFDDVLEGIGADGLPCVPSDPESSSAFLQWLMGLTTTADWIGSSDALCRWERLKEWDGDPSAWFQRSRLLAEEAVIAVGLRSAALPAAPDGLSAVRLALGENRTPRPLQQAVAAVLDSLPNEPALLVIEAPMGEGKTEAALSCAPGSRGIYLAMPTQATSNALFSRLAAFLDAQPDQDQATSRRPYQIGLAHGSGGPSSARLKLQEIGLGTQDSSVQAAWWFQGTKRSLLCAQGIGTVDQGLIGVLQTRHGFLRLFGLSGRTVVLDEVHAYDSYTGGLIEHLIVWLKVLGCRVVLMSATLPAERRKSLLGAWSKGCDTPDAPYPRISWAAKGEQHTMSFKASRRQKVLFKPIGPSAEELAAQASAWANNGARVLIVVNKVARAQKVYCSLETEAKTLFHARFPMQDRLRTERRILQMFGPSGSTESGHVLVATQVAEQSLDIDFDVLITDPAPVDLILQRQGRIHRHQRQRPVGFEEPVVFVGDLDQPKPTQELFSFVYSEWHVLRTLAWLRANSELVLPEGIDHAVQDVYGDWEPEEEEDLKAVLVEAQKTQLKDEALMQSQARQAAISDPLDWRISQRDLPPINDDAAESGALKFGTRLGEDSEAVVPVWPSDLGGLRERAPEMALNHLRLSHRGLIAAVRTAALPPGWQAQPGLASFRPLLLDGEGRVRGSPVAARLDPVLGLVLGDDPLSDLS